LLVIFKVKHDNFTEKWIDYCKRNKIEFREIQTISSESFDLIKECDGFLWHWNLIDFSNYFIAKDFIHVLNRILKIPVFPNYNTVWHYDDKLAQEMIFEISKVAKPKHWFFFNKSEALKWINKANFPVVFKLRKGSGSRNVQLIKNVKEARKIISKMFSSGIKPQQVTLKTARESKIIARIKHIGIKRAMKYFFSSAKFPKEKGYVYFQEFIPGCDRDYRVIVINHKFAYGFTRFVRDNDFRASGSGKYEIDHTKIDNEMVKTAFSLAKKLGLQVACFDFVKNDKAAYLLEMSYDFVPAGGTYDSFWHGFWNTKLEWVEEKVDPVILMIEGLIEEISYKNKK